MALICGGWQCVRQRWRGSPRRVPPPLCRQEVAVPRVQKLLHEEVRNTGPAVPSTKKRRSVGEAMEGSSLRRCPRLRGAQRRGRLGARHTASRQHRVRLVIYGVVLAVLCLRQPRQRKRPAPGYLNLTCSKPSLQSHYRAGRWWVLHATQDDGPFCALNRSRRPQQQLQEERLLPYEARVYHIVFDTQIITSHVLIVDPA